MLDIADFWYLNMHAANENNIGPGKVRGPGALNILIDETNLPFLVADADRPEFPVYQGNLRFSPSFGSSETV